MVKQAGTLKMQVKTVGQGMPLVLVPGGLTGWVSWEPHADRLAATRKVTRVQLLNVQWGLEGRPLPPDYSVKMESRALAAALDDLGFNAPVDLVAWSYGALVTLDYALDHADTVRTLTLIEPPAFWVLRTLGKTDADVEQARATLQGLKGDISEEQLEQFACAVGLCPTGESPRKLPQWPTWLQYRQSLRNSPAVLEHTDNIERLRGFQRPVLLVKGTGSAKFLHMIIDGMAALLPDVRTIELPSGHAPHIISMDRFLERLARFHSTLQ